MLDGAELDQAGPVAGAGPTAGPGHTTRTLAGQVAETEAVGGVGHDGWTGLGTEKRESKS